MSNLTKIEKWEKRHNKLKTQNSSQLYQPNRNSVIIIIIIIKATCTDKRTSPY